jgi:hypothetical protein
MAPPSEPILAPSLRQQGAPPPLSRPPAPPLSPYKLGPIELHPRLSYSHLLSNGLPVLGGRRITSEVRTVSAGLSADLGQHWSLDYSPSWVSYTANAMADSFNQSASLSGGLSFQDLSIQVSQSYSDSNPTLVETARQTEQKSWSTHLGAAYNYSQKLKFNFSTGMAERSTNLALYQSDPDSSNLECPARHQMADFAPAGFRPRSRFQILRNCRCARHLRGKLQHQAQLAAH